MESTQERATARGGGCVLGWGDGDGCAGNIASCARKVVIHGIS